MLPDGDCELAALLYEYPPLLYVVYALPWLLVPEEARSGMTTCFGAPTEPSSLFNRFAGFDAFKNSREAKAHTTMPDGDADGWQHDEGGTLAGGQPQWCKGEYAHFKHRQALTSGDVLRMRVESGETATLGLAGEKFDVLRHGETYNSTAIVDLDDGTTAINPELALDGKEHDHEEYLGPYLPKAPFDLALRCGTDGRPQIQFNDDGVWHDFSPEGRTALKAGPLFPYLELCEGDRVSDLRVDRK